MRKILVVVGLCFAFGVTSASAAEKTWTGQISDAMCGKDHSMMAHDGKKVDARDCTLACVKGGSKYVFVSKGTVYGIDNQDLKDLQMHAGHNVQLTGEMASDGKTLHVSKITMPAGKK
jgi:hypothetical protein